MHCCFWLQLTRGRDVTVTMETTSYMRPVSDFRSAPAGKAPRCRPEEDADDVITDASATLLDENEEWAKVSNA